MNYDVLFLCGAVIGALFLLQPLKELKSPSYSIGVSLLGVIALLYSLKGATPLFAYLNTFMNSQLSLYFKALLKAAGISVVCSITSDIAGELGATSLSGKVELAGKIAIMLTSVPILDNLFVQLEGFVK